MKRIVSLLLLCAFAVSSAVAGEITLYSHRHYDFDDELLKAFSEQTGIKVNVVKAGADELVERLKAEGENTPADIYITADAGRLHKAKAEGLLKSVDSEKLNERIPSSLRDPDGQWYGFTKRARVIVYAKDRVKPSELSTYESLADPKWRGRILVRSSSNIYNQSLLASLIEHNGQRKAQAWAEGVRKNMARPPQGSDRAQMRAVAAGLGDVAIVNTYYIGLLANSPDAKDREVAKSLGVFFPNQNGRGAHVNVSGAGVVKHSDNVEDAVKLLEFMASDYAQKRFPGGTYEYPVVKDVDWSPILKGFGEFKEDSLNLGKLGERNAEAVRTFNRAGWE